MSRKRRRERRRRLRHQAAARRSGQRLAAAGGLTLGATLAMGGVADAACTCTVANTNDTGTGSLRAAITSANSNPGSTITFASGLSGSISLGSTLPSITQPLTIQGPGAAQLSVRGDGVNRDLDIAASAGQVNISGLTITGGSASSGAGIQSSAGLALSSSVVSGNTATSGTGGSGGGIFFYDSSGTLTLADSRVSGNVATTSGSGGGYGGGLFVRRGALSVINSTVSGNRAAGATGSGKGGGIDAAYPGAQLIEGSTISGNTATGASGGGLYVYAPNGAARIENSTFAANQAFIAGGGVFVHRQNSQPITVKDSTIAANASLSPTGFAGGFDVQTGSSPHAVLEDTIISGNAARFDPDVYDSNTSSDGIDAAFSLIGNPNGGNVAQSVPGSDQFGVDPQLGPLQDNGGPTQTMALAPSSPAIDKGSSFGLSTDQRGARRPFDFPTIPNSAAPGADGADIGAFELQPNAAFSFGELKRNKRRGRAKLGLVNPGPDSGRFTIWSRNVRVQNLQSGGTGEVWITVIPKGKSKRKLAQNRHRKIGFWVAFTPTGGQTDTANKVVTLVQRP